MTDNYSGKTDPQTENIRKAVRARKYLKKEDSEGKGKEKEKPTDASRLYEEGIRLMENCGFTVELCEGGHHINHRILKAKPPNEINGLKFPPNFAPLQDISTLQDFSKLEAVFDDVPNEIRDFWTPLFRPKAGETELANFTERLLAMKRINNQQNMYEVLDYGHTFDPSGELCRTGFVANPRVWVPSKSWFDPKLQDVTLDDVFTIFPKAEIEMLKLIFGRIGVGRSNHRPPGFVGPIDHTSRMAAVIVGKDPGLGKSTIFNGFTAALSFCGFNTHTFRSTDDRFGMKEAALADVAYKDDTAMKSLGKFLASEETKILITNGLFQAEQKFQNPEQIWPKCVLIVNSNNWDPFFAYDLDPGIIDRIKILSTYRSFEIDKMKSELEGTVSEGTPDLRPKAHIPYLARKLDVDIQVIYLWCLRLATDRFWEIISNKSDPGINFLEKEVRHWTTRLRIRFKADTSQAIVNAMALCSALREGEKCEQHFMPELSPDVLSKYMRDLFFVGVDKSTKSLFDVMKARWEESGRTSTHYYQAFRELKWKSIQLAIDTHSNSSNFTKASAVILKEMLEKVELRDGFRVSTGLSWVIGDWNNCRYSLDEINREAKELLKHLTGEQLDRLTNRGIQPTSDWLDSPDYSPDRAELFRPGME